MIFLVDAAIYEVYANFPTKQAGMVGRVITSAEGIYRYRAGVVLVFSPDDPPASAYGSDAGGGPSDFGFVPMFDNFALHRVNTGSRQP
jgi:hypothetical protein